MKKRFIIRLLSFLLIVVIVNVILDQLYKKYVVHNILNNAKDENFMEYEGRLKYLSLGNSHNTIDTYILEDAFNYNSPAENYAQSYYKLKSIVEEKKKIPEIVIFYIDMSSFSPRASSYFEHNSYWIKYIDYLELARIKQDKYILNKWVEGKFFSYAGNYRDIKLSLIYLVKIGHLTLHNGYRPPRNFKNFAFERPADISMFSDEADYDWTRGIRVDKKEELRRARAKSSIYFSRSGYFDRAMAEYFEMILKLCLDNGINVILLRSPLTEAYWKDVSELVPVDKLYIKVEGIYNRYPNVIKVFDYHDLFFDHPEYFFDADHLNPKGARLFTIRLKEDLSVNGDR